MSIPSPLTTWKSMRGRFVYAASGCDFVNQFIFRVISPISC